MTVGRRPSKPSLGSNYQESDMRKKLSIVPAELAAEVDRPGPPFKPVEVGAIMRISTGAVYGLIRGGQLKALRLPGLNVVLVERAELKAYLARAKSPAPVEALPPSPTRRRPRSAATA
jgi:hypothetical protein